MRRAAALLALLAACARDKAAALPPFVPYRAIAMPGAGRIDGRVDLPENADPSEVVVWLDDARAGKPVPLERRYEIDNVRNTLVPRVQTAIQGGTLNVRNADDHLHRARFTLTGAADTLLGVVEEAGAGQVVPATQLLARAGLIVVTCDWHPATRAWIRVFDHPYFTQPDSAGRFVLDSVPAGSWRMHAWHPALGARDILVTVDSAGLAFADVRF